MKNYGSEKCEISSRSVIPTRIRLKPLTHVSATLLDQEKKFLPKITANRIKIVDIFTKSTNKFTFLKSLNIGNNLENKNYKNNLIIEEENNQMKKNLQIENIVMKIPKIFKKKYLFADLKNFARKSEFLYKMRLIRILKLVKTNFEKLKLSSQFLIENNVNHHKFSQTLSNTFAILNFEKSFHKRIRIISIHKIMFKIIKKNLLYKLKLNSKLFYQSVELVQSFFKSIIIRKKIHRLKICKNKILKQFKIYQLKKFTQRATLIQKFYRTFLVKKKYKEYITDIKESLRIGKIKAELEEKRKRNKILKNAVRRIEEFWNEILEKRDNKNLEEVLKTMPKECRDLYKKFIILRKQTKNLKQNLSKIGVV